MLESVHSADLRELGAMERRALPGRFPRRARFVLRDLNHDAVVEVAKNVAKKTDTHGEEIALPERRGIIGGPNEAMLLSGDRTAIHGVREPVDRPTGDRISEMNRPANRISSSVAGQE